MDEPRFLFLEGNPAWLDFVNTKFVLGDRPVDRLQTYDDLIDWLRAAGLLDAGTPETAARAWHGREALHRARKLRASLHDAAEQQFRNGRFPASAVRALNELLEAAPGTYRLSSAGGRLTLSYASPPRRALHLLEPLVRSAAQFLAESDLGRIKKCGNEDCVLYYYDTTKNQGRRWCSMALCGNRMKAAAHYRRSKERDRDRTSGL
jgi:predicted RNA-binding Zn ribbon-like protein